MTYQDEYKESLHKHIDAVLQAGKELDVNSWQLLEHDDSKWAEPEFSAYARYFHGDKANVNEFAVAWLHHIHHNPHHWQHWIFPDGYTPKDSEVVNGVIRMPENFALEMVADWMGASYAYTNSWDMTEWLKNHWLVTGKIKLHPDTRQYVSSVLKNLGYGWC